MISNHYTITVPLNGDFAFQTLALNETVEGYDVPRTIFISNKSDKNMIVKVMTKAEGDGTTYTGFFLKAASQLQLKDIGLSYRVGVSYESTQASTAECVVSAMHYTYAEIFA